MIKSNKGQGLIEYLILVSLMAVATMGIIRVLSHTTSNKLAKITDELQGGPSKVKFSVERVEAKHFKKKDMSTFFHGASSNRKGSE